MNADFLVELGTEELPPTALKGLAQAFMQSIESGLQEQHLDFSAIQFFATPRRLAVLVSQLATSQADSVVEKQGPPVKAAFDKDGKPTKAAQGFARNNGVSVDALERIDTDKGERLLFKAEVKGRPATELLPSIVESALNALPVPKRMRWGSHRHEFVRPAHWLLMLLGDQVVNCSILGITAGNTTRGHRFHHNQAIPISKPADYCLVLQETGKVVADFDQRQTMISEQVSALALNIQGVAQIDSALLEEVTALVEWPVALMGRFEERFLQVPAEALISSMKSHQKYFHVTDQSGQLLPNFITVANIESREPQQVVDGNERVIRPRLADAAFFFATDKKTSLEQQRDKLKTIVFQNKIGTVYEKTQRLVSLTQKIAGLIGSDVVFAERAASLSKADLVTEMVREFDSLQGIMGCHYARHDGETEEVAVALMEQYLPKFAGDSLPNTPTGCALALADRLDTLIGIFGIGEPPTGNKDPFALRRAAIGVLNIIIKKQLNLDLRVLLEYALNEYGAIVESEGLVDRVLSYLTERLRGIYTSEGMSAEVFMAVSARNISAPLDFEQRIHAVNQFSQLPAATSLAAANKRVANIIAKEKLESGALIDAKLLSEDAEITLAQQIQALESQVAPLIETKDYTQVLTLLSGLRDNVDAFFDHVMVMADDKAVRHNRMAILRKLRGLFLEVADISQLVVSK